MGGIALCATALLLAMPGSAWAVSSQTDILLLVDTSGSMEGALSSAVSDVNEITDRVRGELGDVQFGVAEVRDYPISIFGNAGSGNVPYRVVQPITGDKSRVSSALFGLYASGGGDLPEAYPRALRDADVGNGLNWRPGARRLVILVADDMPHDNDLNWGIPSSVQISPSPYDTIADPGNDEIVGNGDDIDWQSELGQLAEHGLPLMFVLFEGREELLPYWQIWAGWTGGAAATADTGNLASIVVELARRGATANLPYCPPGQSRDEARRCRPYWEWLGYSFQNGNMPQWATQNGLGRDDVLTADAVERTFSDVKLPTWWAFWRKDPRPGWWGGMAEGVCYGMALSGGRFSTGIDPQLSPADGRSSATWGAPRTPLLPGPLTAADPNFRRELMQTIAASHVSQFSTESYAARMEQSEYFRAQAAPGAAAAERSQLESVMSTGHGQIGASALASERPLGIAMVVIRVPGAGHALVAYDVRETGGGAFQIEVWDNRRPLQISSISVNSDGSWSYPPLGWSGKAGSMTFLPEYPPHGLHLTEGGKSSTGSEVTVAEVPADVENLNARAETDKGEKANVSVQPEITGSTQAQTTGVVTDGSRLLLSFADKHAGATARGSGKVLGAEGLTGGGGGTAEISYDMGNGTVSTLGRRTGTLTVTRGARHVASAGASSLSMSLGGTTVAKAQRGGRVSLVLSSAVGGPLASTTLSLLVPKHGVLQVRGRVAKRAIRHGGTVAVTVRHGRRRETVHVTGRPVASRYRLRARVRLEGHGAKVKLSALRRLPKGSEGWVEWRVKRGGKTVRRQRLPLVRPQIHRPMARIGLPRRLHRVTVKAIVHVLVKKPGPAELVAVGAHRIGHRHRHHGRHRRERR